MHNKAIRFFVLLIMPFSLAAQDKYQLTFEQKGNYSVYNFTANPSYLMSIRDLQGRLGFASELRFYYTPKEKFSYYAGIGFTKYNYKWGESLVEQASHLLPKKGYLLAVDQYYSYNYLGLPLGVKYSFGKRWMAGGGVQVLRLLNQYTYPRYYGEKRPAYNKKTFYKEAAPWALNLQAEVGYTLPILKYDITWKAGFEYAVTDYISNKYPALNLYPYTFSVGASFPLVKF